MRKIKLNLFSTIIITFYYVKLKLKLTDEPYIQSNKKIQSYLKT